MRSRALLLLVALLSLGGGEASADKPRACQQKLRALHVPYRVAKAERGVADPIEVTGPLAGLSFRTWGRKKKLVLDCSLVFSLAMAAPWFVDAGIGEAFYSSALSRRQVRGTNTWSRHSFGLAIDIHEVSGKDVGRITVKDDYEQGLGDENNCVGAPLARAGATLRLLYCQMDRSGLFRFILTPDYDQDHYNHFHLEAVKWQDRRDVDRPLRREPSLAPPAETATTPGPSTRATHR